MHVRVHGNSRLSNATIDQQALSDTSCTLSFDGWLIKQSMPVESAQPSYELWPFERLATDSGCDTDAYYQPSLPECGLASPNKAQGPKVFAKQLQSKDTESEAYERRRGWPEIEQNQAICLLPRSPVAFILLREGECT